MKALVVLVAAGLLAGGLAARAQQPTPDVYSQDQLLGMTKTLEGKTDAAGLGTETLKKYASDYTMLTFRNKSGQAELHEKFADFYVVLEGKARLVSGGQMVHSVPAKAAGEVRGDSITGGKEVAIQKGDIVHVPANIPHQLLLSKGDTLKYFIVKVQEVQ